MNYRVKTLSSCTLALTAISLCAAGEAASTKVGARPDPAAKNPAATRNYSDVQLEVLPVRHNIFVLIGGGAGNVTVQVGDDGVLIVDASVEAMSGKILAALKTLSDRPLRHILDTSGDWDDVGGNSVLSKAGHSISGGNTGPALPAAIFAHESVLQHMSAPTGQHSEIPEAAWPTDTYDKGSLELYFNGEPIQLLYQPAAHTDGDSIVFFRSSDVISTGDVFITTTYPVIDRERGGTINGVIAALNEIIDLTIPKANQEGGTIVVPGHGRLCDEYDVVVYRDMVTVIRDRVQNMIKQGKSLEEVQAARLTRDYDGRYGSTTGPWTTQMFVEAVYRNLSP